MSRLRAQEGMTLAEVLVGAVLLLIVIGATLGTMTQFDNATRANQLQNDAQETARAALDQIARELRNHGVGTPQAPLGVRQAGPYDMVFQTVNSTQPGGSQNSRNIEWARYCLNSSAPANEKLWVQYYTWTSASSPASVPSTASCPDAAWGNQRVLADNLFNRNGGADRPLFTPNSTDPASVTRVGLTAYVNANRGGAASAQTREARLDTSVVLRNENIAPTAGFTVVLVGSNHLVLNASASDDQNGDPLTYQWSYDGTAIPSANGVTLDYDTPTSTGSHTITLTVTDPGGEAASAAHTIDLNTGSVG